MSELDNALDRLGEAVASLISASNQGSTASDADDAMAARVAELTEERDKLQTEIDKLHALRKDDASLRAEATAAVKIALTDLRGLVAAQGATKKKAG
jgi:hypothetical protein